MGVRTVAVKVYSFDALSPKAQERAIETHRNDDVMFHDWWENVYRDTASRLEAFGLSDIDIQFRLSYSQGDGAAFSARVNLAEWLRAMKLAGKYRAIYTAALGKHKSRDANAWVGTRSYGPGLDGMYAEVEAHDSDSYDETLLDKQAIAVEKALDEWAKQQARQIYRDLREENEYLTADDYIRERLSESDLEFTDDGEDW